MYSAPSSSPSPSPSNPASASASASAYKGGFEKRRATAPSGDWERDLAMIQRENDEIGKCRSLLSNSQILQHLKNLKAIHAQADKAHCEPKDYLERVKAAETAMELNPINEKASLEAETVGALNAAMVGARFDR